MLRGKPEERVPSLRPQKIGKLVDVDVSRLSAGSGRPSSQYGQLLVDRSLHPNPVRDHHDFAVEIVRFDVPRAPLQGLPGRSADELINPSHWLQGEAGRPCGGLLLLADLCNSRSIEYSARLVRGVGGQRTPISIAGYQCLEDVANVADQLAVLPRHHILR
jgi:hypothetical protein